MRGWGRARVGLISAVFLALSSRLALASCMANCYQVNTASDTTNASCDVSGIGTCSLRDALTKMALSSNNVIQFAIGAGHQVITLLTDPPDILLPVLIDGTTQPGFAGVPLIEIRKGGTAKHALRTRGPLTNTLTAKALIITGFSDTSCPDTCGGIILSDPADLVRPGGHTIQGCYIGLDGLGTPNSGNVVGILDNSQGANTFGGTTAAERNVISGNIMGIGIGYRAAAYSVASVIQGNYFGTDPTGTSAVPNTGWAVWVGPPYPGFSNGVTIGGSAPGAGNLIVGTSTGVQLNLGINNVVQGNRFGVDATGLSVLGSFSVGIALNGETNAALLNNLVVIAPNGGSYAISLSNSFATATTGSIVQGNFLGTDVTGNHALLTGAGEGISIQINAHHNTIGGAVAGQGNVIGGFSIGIHITGGAGGVPGSIGNVIQGNRIGIGAGGANIGNYSVGILAGAPEGQTVIGGENPGEGNLIVFTGTPVPGSHSGVGVGVFGGAGNKISGNSIYGNTGLGIDLNVDGVTLNDHCDADIGPNNKQNFPVITAVTPGLSTRIQGTLDSTANTVFRLEFFVSPDCDFFGYGQGTTFIGYFDVTTDNSCSATFDVTFPFQTLGSQVITATATDPGGSTSEFSACMVIVVNYYTVPPCRVLDTRNAPGPYGGPPLNSGGFRTFVLAGQCGIPAGATAVSGNIVAVAPAAGPGFLTIYPNGDPRPLASTLNYVVGKTRANNAIMRLGNNGDIAIFCQQGAGTLDIVLDVNGYFQ